MKAQPTLLLTGTVALITFCSEYRLNVALETNLGILIWLISFGNSEAIDAGSPESKFTTPGGTPH